MTGTRYKDDAFKGVQILREWTNSCTAEIYTNKPNKMNDAWNNLTIIFDDEDAKTATIYRVRKFVQHTH